MEALSKFDDIRPYTNEEAKFVFKKLSKHPAIYSIMNIVNPDLSKNEVTSFFETLESVDDFQSKISYPALKSVIKKTSDGLTYDGIDNLNKDESYLFISTHRDIMLDTSLLNFIMLDYGMELAESAIGDNLIQRESLESLAKLNRSFVVKRDSSVREMVANSRHLSEYIQFVLNNKKRSVWIAQREGRTKDGLDATNPGLLKMLTMASDRKDNIVDFLRKMKIVPLSISYEFDPTDRLKLDELIAKENNLKYLKDRNEDFRQIVVGVIGNKKRIHVSVGKPLDKELDELEALSGNKLLKRLSEILDFEIVKNYKLWPTNYIAYDRLTETDRFGDMYNDSDEKSFLRRIEKRAVQHDHDSAERKFLEMYANPVLNKIKKGVNK
ncbi:MAG: 1-acyl-sn-glycerol-3-phosphate acyltransferase [Flavobacteriales bacterium]|nr:1-acyl-sn-glycerol-3-phosphate acyltransferase [Flavobacteriales bacterium]